MNTNIIIGVLIPFVGTTLGSAMVFLMRNRMNKLLEKILLGFAGGVMMAASVWSLLIPSIDMSHSWGKLSFMPAVTIHNFPEGMAVGVVFAGMLSGGTKITLAAAMALSLGIAIQNFPEGAIISMP